MIVKSRFHSRLEVLVEAEVDKRKEHMSTGYSDFNQYWRCVGQIEGLRGALALCEDLEREDQ